MKGIWTNSDSFCRITSIEDQSFGNFIILQVKFHWFFMSNNCATRRVLSNNQTQNFPISIINMLNLFILRNSLKYSSSKQKDFLLIFCLSESISKTIFWTSCILPHPKKITTKVGFSHILFYFFHKNVICSIFDFSHKMSIFKPYIFAIFYYIFLLKIHIWIFSK